MDPFADLEPLEHQMAPDQPTLDRGADLYKKWFRTKTQAGFLTIRPWFEALKLSVDIGEVDVATNKVRSSTLAWANMCEVLAWLSAPAEHKDRLSIFGGGRVDGKPISRILSISAEGGQFLWKTGHFEANVTQAGAYVPNMARALRTNHIKVRALEMEEIRLRLSLALHGWAATHPTDWFATK